MYLELGQKCFFFENVVVKNDNYLNLKDYKIYSTEERQEIINSESYDPDSFLLIPQIERDDIALKFIQEIGDIKLLHQQQKSNNFGKFQDYLEDNNLVYEWLKFEKSELKAFASAWCEKNQIIFTAK